MLQVVHQLCVVKPNEPDSYLEDAMLADTTTQLFAVADGAGGVGVCAGEWANYILQNLPTTPMQDAVMVNTWLDCIYKQFDDSLKNKLQDTALEKYYQQGSLCTLSAIWCQNNTLHSLMIGDSLMMCYNTKTKKLKPFVTDAYKLFDNNPNLINVNGAVTDTEIKYLEHALHPDELYIICTDALAKFIICAYEALKRPNSFKRKTNKLYNPPYKNYIEHFAKAINSFKIFDDVITALHTCNAETLNNWHEQKLLSYDDYTLLLLKPL
jgi:serine/threonine protein phosphatase PrpC